MMNQNANKILSAGANPPAVGASVWTSDKIDRHGQRGLSKGTGEFPMKLFELIRQSFCARRLRQSGPQKALPLQDEAEAAWAEAEELQRRLSAEQEENRRQAIRLQQWEAELHSAAAELDALRRALAALAPSDYEAVYTLLAPELDPDGFHLFRAAEIYTGCKCGITVRSAPSCQAVTRSLREIRLWRSVILTPGCSVGRSAVKRGAISNTNRPLPPVRPSPMS